MEKTRVKVRTHNGKYIMSILVWAGSAITGIAHEPIAKTPQPEVIEHYIPKQYVASSDYKYNPMKSPSNWSKSESRKREIIDRIVSTRLQVRTKAQSSKEYASKYDYYQDKLIHRNNLYGNTIDKAIKVIASNIEYGRNHVNCAV